MLRRVLINYRLDQLITLLSGHPYFGLPLYIPMSLLDLYLIMRFCFTFEKKYWKIEQLSDG